mmetsp:Transcript_41257/g.46888  ORF Transcript_41257/g.46888 Transcript_41257/m.46888 type:complete len:769 (-) Transcript_41257:217-2523(-)|eukprot:CAMPEP_0194179612 /NCGR_PEP_ID=MMETSP0154-20130528/13033_1 /TAXON_ID=1049557 /ORGANISM="Thalassiothrix antarctica, Strain L6-D1" /LENGTH=768 /DNA_ID=CAMNT_0038895021 /DNA_START=159 /DNA_END=2465 /DNA_ORIENTATION=+
MANSPWKHERSPHSPPCTLPEGPGKLKLSAEEGKTTKYLYLEGLSQCYTKLKSESPSSPILDEKSLRSIIEMTPKQQYMKGINESLLSTPLSGSPTSLMLSAKRLASDVRIKHSKRHRGCLFHRRNNTKRPFILQLDRENGCFKTASTGSISDQETDESWSMSMACLSPEERSNYYWKLCYGSSKLSSRENSWSALRQPPVKSCLSSTKSRIHNGLPYSPLSPVIPDANLRLSPHSYSITQCFCTPMSRDSRKERRVQFGALSAAEFHLDVPTSSALKLLEPAEVMKRYSISEAEKEDENETNLMETRFNSNILAEWEDDFDDYLCLEENNEPDSNFIPTNSNRRNRRSSRLFTRTGLSLLSNEEDKIRKDTERKHSIFEVVEDQEIITQEKNGSNVAANAAIHNSEDKSHQLIEMPDFLKWNNYEVLERLMLLSEMCTGMPHNHSTEFYEVPLKSIINDSWAAIAKRILRSVPKGFPPQDESDKNTNCKCEEECLNLAQDVAFQDLKVYHVRALRAVEKELQKLNSSIDKELNWLDEVTKASAFRLEKLTIVRLELEMMDVESNNKLVSARLDEVEAKMCLEMRYGEVVKYMALESLVDPFIEIREDSFVQVTWEQKDSYSFYANFFFLENSEISLSAEWLHSSAGNMFMKFMLWEKPSLATGDLWIMDSGLWKHFLTPHEVILHISLILGRIEIIKDEIDRLENEAEIQLGSNNQIVIVLSLREITIYFEKGNLSPIGFKGVISEDDKCQFPNLFGQHLHPKSIMS